MKIMTEIAKIHVAILKESVKDLPIELIFNLCDIGGQERADQNTRQIITTHHIRLACIEYSVRGEKNGSIASQPH
jgi:hypothetical protein